MAPAGTTSIARGTVAPVEPSGRTHPITRADLLDAGEVADLVRVDRRTILRWAHEGMMPSIKRGRRVLFLRSQIEQWLLAGARGQVR